MDEIPYIVHLKGATGAARTETHDGREHLVVPVVALMEAVVHAINAPEAEFVPFSVLSASPSQWNGRPAMLGHPTDGKKQISANAPKVLEAQGFGMLSGAQARDGKLSMEAWLDVAKAERLGERGRSVIRKLRAGEPVEVSVGAYVHTKAEPGEHNGEAYKTKWASLAADHLAFLPDGRGACSLEMGCGALRAAEDGEDELDVTALRDIPTTQLDDAANSDFAGPNRSFPILKPADVSAAAHLIGKADDPAAVKARIIAIAKRKGQAFVDQLPEAWMKTMSDRLLSFFGNLLRLDDGGKGQISDVKVKDATGADFVAQFQTLYGARNSAADMKTIQSVHDHSVALGASCDAEPMAMADGGIPAEGEGTMTKEQREGAIKALLGCECSGFTAANQKLLESASDAELDQFKANADKTKADRASLKAAQDKTTEAQERVTALETQVKTLGERKLTTEEFLQAAPEEVKRVIADHKASVEARTASLVSVLKTAQQAYTEDELKAMSVDQLEKLAKVAKAEEPRPDFSGRPMPRAAASHSYAAPDPYALALKK